MRTYEFTVTETLKRKVRVDAESRGEAESLVENLYDNETIVLDAEDLDGDAEIEYVNDYPVINQNEGIDHYAKTDDGINNKFYD